MLALYAVERAPSLQRWLTPFYQSHQLNLDAAASFCATVAQLAGVFIGLYFAALGGLASTSYRDVPAAIRATVVEERAGSFYLRLVAFTGAAAVYESGLLSYEISPGVLNLGVLVLLAAASTIAFVILGLRAFTFFDPSAVTGFLVVSIRDASVQVTPRGFRWNESSFQAAAQKQAEESVDTLRALARVAADSPFSAARLLAIGAGALNCLGTYCLRKPDIPSASLWFPRIAKHRSWLSAGPGELPIGLASRTGVGLPPKMEPDDLWLERRLLDVVVFTVSMLVERREFANAATLLQGAQRVLDQLARGLQLDTAVRVNEVLVRLVVDSFVKTTDEMSLQPATGRPAELLLRLAVLDGLIAGPCVIIAGVGAHAQSVTVGSINDLAQRVATDPAHWPIGRPVAPTVRGNVAFFRRALLFERKVEGERLTPTWFVAHHLARVYTADLVDAANTLGAMATQSYSLSVSTLIAAGEADAAVIAVQRGIEAADKLRFHNERIRGALDRLRSVARAFGEQDWASFDPNPLDATASGLHAEMVLSLAKAARRLPRTPPTGEIPDAFGYAATTLAEEAFTAVLDGNRDLFAELFPTVLDVALSGYDRVRAELARHPLHTQLAHAGDLVLDVLDLSGYAYLDHSIEGGDAWEAVRTAWDAYVAARSGASDTIRMVIAIDSWRSNQVMMSGRDMIRSGWDQRFGRWMQKRGVAGEQRSRSLGYDGVRAIPLDLVAHAFCRRHVGKPSARDLFHVAYVVPRGEGIELTRSAQGLARDIDQIAEWRRAAREAGDGPLSEDWDTGWLASSPTRTRRRHAKQAGDGGVIEHPPESAGNSATSGTPTDGEVGSETPMPNETSQDNKKVGEGPSGESHEG